MGEGEKCDCENEGARGTKREVEERVESVSAKRDRTVLQDTSRA